MPTLAQVRLPPPRSWEEFEAIVASALGTREHLEGPHRYGRNGQNQQGIDIYLVNAYSHAVAVQCKCVESFSFSEVEAAVKLAANFTQMLDLFIVALSMPRDAVLQAKVFALSKQRALANEFRVGLWFWDDVVDDLSRDVVELARHYPQFFAGNGGPISVKNRLGDAISEAQLAAYKELWSYLHGRFLPTRTHPDYDWGDAREDIALFLDRHAAQLSQLHTALGSSLPRAAADSLSSAVLAAQDGAFVVSPSDNFAVPQEALEAAESTYEHLSACLAALRSALEKRGVHIDPTHDQ